MSLHALNALDDALTATRRYRPRGLGEWAWVGIVAVTVASPAVGVPSGGSGGTGEASGPEGRAALEEVVPGTLADVLVVALAVAAALWLSVTVLGALLEFPFLRWLREGDLAVRETVAEHWRQALGLAVFRLVVGGVGFAAIAAVLVTTVGTGGDPLEYLLALADRQATIALVSLLTGLVAALTTAFVLPVMVIEDRGVLGGWRRLWPTLTGAPKQFLAYVVAVAVVAYVGGVLVALAALAVLLPVAVLAVVLAVAVGGPAAVVVAAVIGGTAATVVVVAAYTLLQVYLRFYALLVLGDIDEDLDLIPERRRELRADPEAEREHGGPPASEPAD